MIAFFTTTVFSMGCWFVWFDWWGKSSQVSHNIVMDISFIFWIVTIAVNFLCPVSHCCLMFPSCLDVVFLVAGHFVSNNLTQLIVSLCSSDCTLFSEDVQSFADPALHFWTFPSHTLPNLLLQCIL